MFRNILEFFSNKIQIQIAHNKISKLIKSRTIFSKRIKYIFPHNNILQYAPFKSHIIIVQLTNKVY